MELKEDLINRILKYVAAESDGIKMLNAPKFCDSSPAEIHYHIGLCEDAGLLEVSRATGVNDSEVMTRYMIKRLTWEGHQRLKNS